LVDLKLKKKKEKQKEPKPIKGISKQNSDLILQYCSDMAQGKNVAPTSTKGPRAKDRVGSLKSKMKRMTEFIEELFGVTDLRNLTDDYVLELINGMRTGKYRQEDGNKYESVDSYAKTLAAFWHWYMRIERKKDNHVQDIMLDVKKTGDKKPPWVYMNQEEFNKFVNRCKWDYKILCTFIYDSGIRSPWELKNIKVSDITWDEKNERYQLYIRDEVSKTFARKIKLMLCTKLLKEWLAERNGKELLFDLNPEINNQYLKRVAERIWGEKTSKGRKKYKDIIMMDLRHSSACYWLPRYKSESNLKYRFGWKKSDMIHYYSEFLGMTDNIQEEDLLVDVSATELQNKFEEEKNQRLLMEENMQQQQKEFEEYKEAMNPILEKLMQGLDGMEMVGRQPNGAGIFSNAKQKNKPKISKKDVEFAKGRNK